MTSSFDAAALTPSTPYASSRLCAGVGGASNSGSDGTPGPPSSDEGLVPRKPPVPTGNIRRKPTVDSVAIAAQLANETAVSKALDALTKVGTGLSKVVPMTKAGADFKEQLTPLTTKVRAWAQSEARSPDLGKTLLSETDAIGNQFKTLRTGLDKEPLLNGTYTNVYANLLTVLRGH